MKITKIKKLKNGKYKLFLENGEEIITYDDLILEKDLLLTKEISFQDLKLLSLETDYYATYYKMVQKISTKLRSEKEIEKLLEKEALTEKEKKSILEKLRKAGLINDERFMKAYISDRVHLSTDGPYLILKELENLGIEVSSIENIFTEEEKKVLDEKLYKYIEKKIKTNTKYSTYLFKQKMIEHFTHKGFEREKIVEILENCQIDIPSVLEKEYQKIYTKLSKKYEGQELLFKVKQKLLSKGFKKDEIENYRIGE